MVDIGEILKGLLGEGSVAQQFLVWGVLNQIVSGMLNPTMTALQNKINADHPEAPLSPGDLATMVVREIVDQGWATGEAAKSGVPADDFAKLVENAGVGPTITNLFQLYRLGKINDIQLDQGMAKAGIDPQWFEIVKLLMVSPPTAQEVLNAYLQGQISQDEAVLRYNQAGADPTWFQAAVDSEGSAPTPSELSVMANRGIIGWSGTGPTSTSFEQGFLEGPWRNKWLDPYKQLAVYVPPPETITTLAAGGYISDADAIKAYQATGMTQAMAAAYLAHAHGEATAKTKDLAVGEITTLYTDRAIDSSTATGMLEALGYNKEDAAFILTIQDLQRDRKFLEGAISKIESLYVSYKITRANVLSSLASLEVPNSQISDLIQIWDLERSANVKQLSASEIASAVYYSIIDWDTAITKLGQIGYQPFDAFVLLADRLHGVPQGVTPPPDTSITA